MADTFTLTLDLKFPQRVGAYGKLGIISGVCNISSYNQTKATMTGITGLFQNLYRVVPDTSASGYAIHWDTTAKAFRAFDTGASSGNALSEAANATNVGAFNFIAIGQIGGG